MPLRSWLLAREGEIQKRGHVCHLCEVILDQSNPYSRFLTQLSGIP